MKKPYVDEVRAGWVTKDLEERDLLAKMVGVAKEYGVTIRSLLGGGRTRRVAQARFEAWRVLHDLGFSSPEIADIFRTDHSSVCRGVRLAEAAASSRKGTA